MEPEQAELGLNSLRHKNISCRNSMLVLRDPGEPLYCRGKTICDMYLHLGDRNTWAHGCSFWACHQKGGEKVLQLIDMQFGDVLSTRSLGYRGGSVHHLGLLIGWLSASVSFFLVKCSPEEKLRMDLWNTDYSVFLLRTVMTAGNVSVNIGNSRKQMFIYRYHRR